MKINLTQAIFFALVASLGTNNLLSMEGEDASANPRLPHEIIDNIKAYRKGQAKHDAVIMATCPSLTMVKEALIKNNNNETTDMMEKITETDDFEYFMDNVKYLFDGELDINRHRILKFNEAWVDKNQTICSYTATENDVDANFEFTMILTPKVNVKLCTVVSQGPEPENSKITCERSIKDTIINGAKKDAMSLDLAANQKTKHDLSNGINPYGTSTEDSAQKIN